MVEGIRIGVHFDVHMHEEVLKEYPRGVVEKWGRLVDRERVGKTKFYCLRLYIFCFMKQQKVFSV